jgi:predicted AAA+ superfamily ATPase
MRPSETENEAFHVPRLLNLPALLEKKSYFLFGPRQAGKTSLIRCILQEARVYDLLNTSVYLTLSQDPGKRCQVCTLDNSISG